ncbi:MAG: sensor histidine kinase [Verrucomicrobia bacterium]|nr:sensor histidine kinase [Verrucomicrobiota bacterium]
MPAFETSLLNRSLALGRLSCALAMAGIAIAQETPQSTSPLTTAAQVLSLNSAEAGRQHRVRLRGVVTFFEKRTELFFVQDETAGIYVYPKNWLQPAKAGDMVEVTGTTGAGSFSPFLNQAEINILASGRLPAPKIVAMEQLAAGQEDCQWVQVEGVLRKVSEDWGHLVLELAAGRSRLKARVAEVEPGRENLAVDSRVRIQGTVGASFDTRRRVGGFHLMVPSLRQVTVLKAGSPDAYSASFRTARSLKMYSPGQGLDHRVRLSGVVTLHWPKRFLFIRDETGSTRIQTEEGPTVEHGETVDVAGFIDLETQAPTLTDAVFRSIKKGDPPRPVTIAPSHALSGEFDNELVRIEATLTATESGPSGVSTLALRADQAVFHARTANPFDGKEASRLAVGSRVLVTGICARERSESGSSGGLSLLLRSPQDLMVIEQPPGQKSHGLAWMQWGLALALLSGLGWVGLLRKRVASQTEFLRKKEASLEKGQSENDLRKALEERERIGRDLHDGIIQSIYAVGLNLEDCKRLVSEKPSEVESRLARVLTDLNGVIRDVRNFISGLETGALRGQEFKTAVKSIVLMLGEAHAPRFALQIDSLAAESLTSPQATQLLHIAREAVSNSVRHAQAERTILSLQPHNGKIRFEVRDNGVGFNTDAVLAGGRGLRNMAARARELGAAFSVVSQIGQGTRIVLDIPAKTPHESA